MDIQFGDMIRVNAVNAIDADAADSAKNTLQLSFGPGLDWLGALIQPAFPNKAMSNLGGMYGRQIAWPWHYVRDEDVPRMID